MEIEFVHQMNCYKKIAGLEFTAVNGHFGMQTCEMYIIYFFKFGHIILYFWRKVRHKKFEILMNPERVAAIIGRISDSRTVKHLIMTEEQLLKKRNGISPVERRNTRRPEVLIMRYDAEWSILLEGIECILNLVTSICFLDAQDHIVFQLQKWNDAGVVQSESSLGK